MQIEITCFATIGMICLDFVLRKYIRSKVKFCWKRRPLRYLRPSIIYFVPYVTGSCKGHIKKFNNSIYFLVRQQRVVKFPESGILVFGERYRQDDCRMIRINIWDYCALVNSKFLFICALAT